MIHFWFNNPFFRTLTIKSPVATVIKSDDKGLLSHKPSIPLFQSSAIRTSGTTQPLLYHLKVPIPAPVKTVRQTLQGSAAGERWKRQIWPRQMRQHPKYLAGGVFRYNSLLAFMFLPRAVIDLFTYCCIVFLMQGYKSFQFRSRKFFKGRIFYLEYVRNRILTKLFPFFRQDGPLLPSAVGFEKQDALFFQTSQSRVHRLLWYVKFCAKLTDRIAAVVGIQRVENIGNTVR